MFPRVLCGEGFELAPATKIFTTEDTGVTEETQVSVLCLRDGCFGVVSNPAGERMVDGKDWEK